MLRNLAAREHPPQGHSHRVEPALRLSAWLGPVQGKLLWGGFSRLRLLTARSPCPSRGTSSPSHISALHVATRPYTGGHGLLGPDADEDLAGYLDAIRPLELPHRLLDLRPPSLALGIAQVGHQFANRRT